MNPLISASLLLAAASTLSAQSVSVAMDVVAPVTLQADVAGLPASQVLPLGPLVGNGQFHATQNVPTVGYARSGFAWFNGASSQQAEATLRLEQTAAGLGVSDTTPIEVLFTITATTPTNVRLEILRGAQTPGSTSIGTNRIDIGDDGVIDLFENSEFQTFHGPFQVVGSLGVRLFLDASAVVDGNTLLAVNTIRVLPANDLVINHVSSGCLGDVLQVAPSFVDRGLALTSVPAIPGDLAVAVFGVNTQPVLLPIPLAQCLLLPAPDLLVVLPPQLPIDFGLPAAFRPLGFWLQAVVLSGPNALTSTDSFAIVAL